MHNPNQDRKDQLPSLDQCTCAHYRFDHVLEGDKCWNCEECHGFSKSDEELIPAVPFKCKNCPANIKRYPCPECGTSPYDGHKDQGCWYSTKTGVTLSHYNASEINTNCNNYPPKAPDFPPPIRLPEEPQTEALATPVPQKDVEELSAEFKKHVHFWISRTYGDVTVGPGTKTDGFDLLLVPFTERLKAFHTKAITDLITEIREAIGQDEKPLWDEESSFCDKCEFERTDDSRDCLCVIRNKLRKKQRAALDHITKKYTGSDE